MPTTSQQSSDGCSPWRADFPALAHLQHHSLTYLDSAATSQKPAILLEAMEQHYRHGVANVHRAQHPLGEAVTQAFEDSRATLAKWLGAATPEQVILTRSTTEAINLLAYGLEAQIQPGDELVISASEHHANLLPWQQLAQRRKARLMVLPLRPQGDVDLEAARQLIGSRTRLLAVTQLSNVLGVWQPLAELLPLAHQQGALTVVDGAQGAVHRPPNGQAPACDFYVCSAHKLYGPEGVGVLYGSTEALSRLKHWQFGGEMVQQTDFQHARFLPPPLGFEAGTPAIGAVIGFAAVIKYLQALDTQAWQHHEQQLHSLLLEGLKQRPGLHLLGQPEAALASFTVENVHAADLAYLLGEQGIAVRAGNHCAMPLLQQLGVDSAVRVSLGLYNDKQDLALLFSALDRALELLR